MFVIVAYDITEDRRRNRVAKVLEDFGDRVQGSVFECRLETPQIEQLCARLNGEILPDQDNIRIYSLCGTCSRTIRNLGQSRGFQTPDVYIV